MNRRRHAAASNPELSALAGFRFPPGGDHAGGALASAVRTVVLVTSRRSSPKAASKSITSCHDAATSLRPASSSAQRSSRMVNPTRS